MKALLSRLNIDVYIALLLATVALASLLPARGGFAPVAHALAQAGIVLLFFLHGARLSREAVLGGLAHWRLHLTVAALTFGLFPLLGIGLRALPGLDPALGAGLLFLTLLPSTVQSSIAFTAMAGGNVAAAVCSASFSNLAGMVVTPALAALLLGGAHGGIPGDAVLTIAFQLLLPFLAGHMLRGLIGEWIGRRRRLVMVVDRGSILLVVYTAFSAAVVEGLWQRVSLGDLALLVLLASALLAAVLAASWWIGGRFGFSRADRIVVLFCGSKKSLASGVPMAGALFAAPQVGTILLPLMVFHQIQLMACAVIARRLSDSRAGDGDGDTA